MSICFVSWSLHQRIKSLTVHFLLPTLGCAKEKDVDDFIITQALSGVECTLTTQNLLGVNATDMHDVLFHTYAKGLPCNTLKSFVGQGALESIRDRSCAMGFAQVFHNVVPSAVAAVAVSCRAWRATGS